MDAEKTNQLVTLITICSGTIFIGCILELFRLFLIKFKIKSKYVLLFVLAILIVLKIYTNVSYSIVAWSMFGLIIGAGIIDFLIEEKI